MSPPGVCVWSGTRVATTQGSSPSRAVCQIGGCDGVERRLAREESRHDGGWCVCSRVLCVCGRVVCSFGGRSCVGGCSRNSPSVCFEKKLFLFKHTLIFSTKFYVSLSHESHFGHFLCSLGIVLKTFLNNLTQIFCFPFTFWLHLA